jgi:hypothetical protein
MSDAAIKAALLATRAKQLEMAAFLRQRGRPEDLLEAAEHQWRGLAAARWYAFLATWNRRVASGQDAAAAATFRDLLTNRDLVMQFPEGSQSKRVRRISSLTLPKLQELAQAAGISFTATTRAAELRRRLLALET